MKTYIVYRAFRGWERCYCGWAFTKICYKLLKSYTTRQPRNADDDGHYFISKMTLEKLPMVYFSIILVICSLYLF